MAKKLPGAAGKAAPRRVASPKPPPQRGGTPVVLIIFLVFFILLSLGLGVLVYLDQDKIDSANKRAEQALAEAKKWQEAERIERQYFTQKLRYWWDNTAADAQDLRTLADMESEWSDPGKNDPRTDADHKWFAPLRALMEGDPNARDPEARRGLIGPYDNQNGKTATSMKELLENLRKQVATLNVNLREEQDKLAKKTQEFEDYKKEYNRDVIDAEIRKVRTDYERQMKARLDEKDRTIADLTKKMEEVTRDFEKMLAERKKVQDAELAKKDEEVKEIKRQVDLERAEIRRKAQAAEQLAIDKVRARVIRTTPGDHTVYIDVGSDQRVVPGLKFSVRGVGPGGNPEPEPKAMVEVISVVGPTVSLARITRVAKPEFARMGRDPVTRQRIDPTTEGYWITDPRQFYLSRNPVVPGDLLYNPLWDPNEPVHVVLAGFFDLDNDGTDDLDYFRRYLTDIGVKVDGYLDPNADNKLKGKLDYQTDYLIVGGLPTLEVGATAPPIEDQIRQAIGGPTGKAVLELNKQALEKGVAVVRLKDFLTKMGITGVRIPGVRATQTGPVAGGAPAGDEAKPAQDGAPKPPNRKVEEEEEAPRRR